MGKPKRRRTGGVGANLPPRDGMPPSRAQSLATGLQHHRAGRLGQAEAIYREVLRGDPDNPDALHLLGRLALQAEQWTAAADLIGRALRIRPREASYHSSMALALSAQGDDEAAIACYGRALDLNPGRADLHNNLGNLLLSAGRVDLAIQHLERAVALDSQQPESHNNLGTALHRKDLRERAVEHYRHAIALRPDYAEAWFNCGKALKESCRLEEALQCYEQGLRLRTGVPEANAGYGLALLLAGDMERGWEHYEYRPRVQDPELSSRDALAPGWEAQGNSGKIVLAHAEQGFGDTIQFARLVPALAARGMRVVFEVQPELKTLISTVPGIGHVIARGEPRPPFDLHCPLLSLARALGIRMGSIPASVPYLSADPQRIKQWHARFPAGGAMRVGLAWAGNPRHHGDRDRSVSPTVFRLLSDIDGILPVSLQQGTFAAPAVATGEWRPYALGLEPTDFADTAAIVAQLDLVISVDTAVAHLAGAMGKPVWLMLPYFPDWRWMLEREDSPWYPTMRLFRQRQRGDWAEVLGRIARELSRMATGDSSQPESTGRRFSGGAPSAE